MDIETFEKPDGSVIVNCGNGFPLVNGSDSYALGISGDDIVWTGSSGTGQVITDKISEGKIGGLLIMRDEVIPKYQAQVNELAREMIYAVNYQYSQGAGLEYYKDDTLGTYATDDSRWLTSFEYGDKLDFSGNFSMWVQDKTDADTLYNKIEMDMGISEARITNWSGTAPSGDQSIYKLTVVEEGMIGDQAVFETDGDGLGAVLTSTSATGVTAALDTAIADQVLRVYSGPDGTQVINIKDVGGNAARSAASIAAALNEIGGVSAHASATSATLEVVDTGGIQDGDTVSYSLYIDGVVLEQSFIRDSEVGSLDKQMEYSLIEGAEAINGIMDDSDLTVSGLTLTSDAGRTIGVENFEVQDNSGIRLDSFADFDAGDTVTFLVDSSLAGSGTAAASTTEVEISLANVDTSDQVAMAQAFYDALSAELDTDTFTVDQDPYTGSVVIRTIDGSGIRLRNGSGDTGDDAVVNVTALAGSDTTAAAANTELRFNNVVDDSDLARYDAVAYTGDEMTFSGNGTSATLTEVSSGAGDMSAVITGTVTTLVEEGMALQTTVAGTGTGGLFSTNTAWAGSSILTFGGEGDLKALISQPQRPSPLPWTVRQSPLTPMPPQRPPIHTWNWPISWQLKLTQPWVPTTRWSEPVIRFP